MKNKIAFIKFGGMAIGGTEKVLQTIASELPKTQYQVDYFYCDSAPYIGSNYKHLDTDLKRVEYCIQNKVNLIKFRVGFKDLRVPTHDWVDTNFWDYFNEDEYDVIITGRAGHPEYPFNLIHKTKIIDTIHLSGMAENKVNVHKTVLISKEQRDRWVGAGGIKKKSMIIPNPVKIVQTNDKFETNNKFVFGLHQRDDDNIFSPIPLEAYKKIETKETLFMFLGGSSRYKDQAKSLEVKNIKFIPTTSDIEEIHKFLNSLDVYAHGRSDGEQCSTAIIEAMSHGLPFISHVAPSMGHAEQIQDAGLVVKNNDEYSDAMVKFMRDKNFYSACSEKSLHRYDSIYSLASVIAKYVSLIEDTVSSNKLNTLDRVINSFENIFIYFRLRWKRIKNKLNYFIE